MYYLCNNILIKRSTVGVTPTWYNMIQICRKEGWDINPNDKVVNGILRMLEKNNGECPCHNESVNKQCPCSDYKEKDICHCTLYVKKDEQK